MSLGPMRVPRFPKVLASTSAALLDTGVVFFEAAGFEHYAFQLTGTFTNYTVSIYGTLDPQAVTITPNTMGASQPGPIGQIGPNLSYPAPGAAGGAWALVAAPSEQSGTGSVVNPLVGITTILETKIPYVAFWIHIVGASPTGTVNVVGWAID